MDAAGGDGVPQNLPLDWLPVEINEAVFSWLRIICEVEKIPFPLAPLSKSLLSIQHSNIYQNVVIHHSQLLDFCDTALRHSLHSHILSFCVVGEGAEKFNWRPHEGRIWQLFHRARRLVKVDVQASVALSFFLLTRPFASFCIPNVQQLTIRIVPISTVYANLRELECFVRNDGATDESHWDGWRNPNDKPTLPPDVVTSFAVHGHANFIGTRGLPLISTFRLVDKFQLCIHGQGPFDIGNSLARLDSSIIRHLRLSNTSDSLSPPVDRAITRFRHLESLRLTGRIFSPQLFPLLHSFPHLSRLFLDCNDEAITPALLRSILVGPTKIQSLKSLEFFESRCNDISEGPIHPADNLKESLSDIYPIWFPHGAWKLPSWPPGFPLRDVKQIVRLAEEQGVKLDRVREAVRVQESYIRECRRVDEYFETPAGKKRLARAEELQKDIELVTEDDFIAAAFRACPLFG